MRTQKEQKNEMRWIIYLDQKQKNEMKWIIYFDEK